MARVKRGTTTHARHKKVLDLAKGYRGRGSKAYRIALEKVEKALRYAYRDRRNKKRDFRGLWIQRINAGVREHGMTYSQFIHGLKLVGPRTRPQGAVRPRDPRAGSVRQRGRDRKVGAVRSAYGRGGRMRRAYRPLTSPLSPQAGRGSAPVPYPLAPLAGRGRGPRRAVGG